MQFLSLYNGIFTSMINDAIWFQALNAYPCSQSYETKQLVQEDHCYEFRITSKDQINANGVMSIVVKDANKKNITKILIQKLSSYKSVFYKCSEQNRRLHFGVLLKNDFIIQKEGQKQIKFSHCLIHSFVTSQNNKQTALNLQFKNHSDFTNEMAAVLGSKQGIYLLNTKQVADRSSTAYVLVDFIHETLQRPFEITGNYNCSHFQACLNFLLSGDLDFRSDYQNKYYQFFNGLPDHIKQLAN
ncbi:hypothetical protein ABPG72_003912 [Tetrahymena utriculariae]